MKIIELYNGAHLGDCVYSIIILNKTAIFLEKDDIHINLYCNQQYLRQLQEFIKSKRIILHPLEHKGLEIWIGNREFTNNFFDVGGKIPYDEFYVRFANELYNKLNIPLIIDKIEYEDDDLLVRYNRLPEKYKNVDYLIINSQPMSGQVLYIPFNWSQMVRKLSQNNKVVTTLKINGINCTLDEGLSIKDIAAISTNAKNIIAINTGPFAGCLNVYALNYVKKWVVYDKTCAGRFSYKNFEWLTWLQV
jgi:hypothetical protein